MSRPATPAPQDAARAAPFSWAPHGPARAEARHAPAIERQRYVVCVPIGGLNDRLVQIAKCWDYALRWNRTLIVEGERGHGLRMDFWKIFDPGPPDGRPGRPRIDMAPDLAALGALSIHPESPDGRVIPKPNQTIRRSFGREVRMARADTGAPLTFDFRQDHDAEVLLHMQFGEGTQSHDLLRHLVLRDSVRDEIAARLAHLPDSYIALHIRNTDMRSDYRAFLRRHAAGFAGQDLLVCSDDANAIAHVQETLGRTRVFVTRSQASSDGTALHQRPWEGAASQDAKVLDALTDLIALGRATRLHAPASVTPLGSKWQNRPVVRAYHRVRLRLGYPSAALRVRSGFSTLAMFLTQNPDVCASLMGHAPHAAGPRPARTETSTRDGHA